ncbi:MAG: hypothetical protein ACTHM1_10815 [Solirubrobacteraceae bacterium]
MTPPATAAAARAPVRAPRRAATAPASRRAAVRHPRRISGPARPLAAAAAPAIALPQAPVRRPRHRAGEAPGIALRAIDVLAGASNSPFLDRLIRSRLWIGILAFLLIGIVAMQLFVLKLNSDIGQTLAREAALERQNTLTQIGDSSASAGNLVEPTAAAAGMTVAPAGSLHFVAVSHSDLARAVTALRTPVAEAPSTEATSTGTSSTGTASAETGSTEAASGEAPRG